MNTKVQALNRRRRENHPRWKGGKFITDRGYISVLVGIEHHLAHCDGYAYEHRLVAEEKMGRRLTPKDSIHHINGIKTDNRPENIEVLSNRMHSFKHRPPNCVRRKPDEPNPVVECACGCGTSFKTYSDRGLPRKYINGHHNRIKPRSPHGYFVTTLEGEK